ncbi:hypothetical protein GCM10009853_016020 [Glycomyces scopariae]
MLERMATSTAARALPPASPRRRELADFLRSRRERLTPAQVGLPPGRRRRTPGLRREEVAQLASVGISWYTWLEQGRDISASAQVLDAVARALRLDASERAHLFTLAGAVDPVPRAFRFEVPDSVRAILERLDPFPASVQNLRYDLLAYNRTFGNLLCDLDALPPGDRNCMWLAFTNPNWRAAMVERRATLELMVANFRNAGSAHFDEPQWSSMVDRLRAASDEFCEIWDRHDVAAEVKPVKVFRNRFVGEVRFAAERMWLQPKYGVRMTVFSPADPETATRLTELRALIDADRAALDRPTVPPAEVGTAHGTAVDRRSPRAGSAAPRVGTRTSRGDSTDPCTGSAVPQADSTTSRVGSAAERVGSAALRGDSTAPQTGTAAPGR